MGPRATVAPFFCEGYFKSVLRIRDSEIDRASRFRNPVTPLEYRKALKIVRYQALQGASHGSIDHTQPIHHAAPDWESRRSGNRGGDYLHLHVSYRTTSPPGTDPRRVARHRRHHRLQFLAGHPDFTLHLEVLTVRSLVNDEKFQNNYNMRCDLNPYRALMPLSFVMIFDLTL